MTKKTLLIGLASLFALFQLTTVQAGDAKTVDSTKHLKRPKHFYGLRALVIWKNLSR